MSGLPTPFFEDATVTLYCGDAMEILRWLPRAAAIVTDPPYNSTDLAWDSWPVGWPALAALITDQLWCFGSLLMFWDRVQEFAGWQLAQDVVWEKHNGSSPASDRFRRVHELAVHFYRGKWRDMYKAPVFTNDATARQVRRKKKPAHWPSMAGPAVYTTTDGGPRRMRSVIYARGCHGYAVNETQKPEAAVDPLVAFSVPPGGLVVDPFAGSGTTLAVARRLGRRSIGIEKRASQCELIVERLAQHPLPLGDGPRIERRRIA